MSLSPPLSVKSADGSHKRSGITLWSMELRFGDPSLTGEVLAITIGSGSLDYRLPASHSVERLGEAELATRSNRNLALASRSEQRAILLKLFTRAVFNGKDTLDTLHWPVMLAMDAVHFCPPAGLLLRGWFADPFEQIRTIRLRSGDRTQPIDRARWIRIARQDVVDVLGPKHGLNDDRPGFLVFVPDIYSPGIPTYFEFETAEADVVYRPIDPPTSTGLAPIKEMLGLFELRYQDLARGYDAVVGPAVEAMNEFRLQSRPRELVVTFGKLETSIRCSIIVPLYGRIDFMEYQLAFFAEALAADHELIYVLDDPRATREAEALAAACFARFSRPFTLICLSRNMGYAPANNIGLRHAGGEFVCFLNSDVFARDRTWLEHILQTAMLPDVGAVGALLLFEDGTLQHEGCATRQLPEFGNWTFCVHPNKGRFPVASDTPVTTVDALTGACLVLRRELAIELGGFDEGYVIGDFEDVDLCRKVQARGLTCVVDRRAVLYHLERQSQGDQSRTWRTNLTLYNAWRFNRKWIGMQDEVQILQASAGSHA